MSVRKYSNIFVRVDYPAERGYRMEPKELPPWLSIEITETDDSKQLIVNSTIHVNTSVKVGPSYSTEFTDIQMIKELSAQISHMFL